MITSFETNLRLTKHLIFVSNFVRVVVVNYRNLKMLKSSTHLYTHKKVILIQIKYHMCKISWRTFKLIRES
jgi:hypothetical protein